MTRLQQLHLLRPAGSAARLRDLVQRRRHVPFAWGSADCCLWAADAVLATIGRDPAADLRSRYSSARGALRLLAQHGGMASLVTARLGPLIDAADAIDGDVCLLAPHAHERIPSLGALGVLWRGHILAQGDVGLVARPVDDAVAWWGATP
jgi:hypothetical protein